MDDVDLRRMALALPETEEKSHFGQADFRVRNKIFAVLPAPGQAVVKLTANDQSMLTDAEPKMFSPVNNAWGRHGWTQISLPDADEITLRSAIVMAWRNVAPARLLAKTVDVLGH
jgi:hypothetical protein